MPRIFLLALGLVLVINLACENEEEKMSRLYRSHASIEKSLQTQQAQWEYLQEEKLKNEQASAKERFAFLQKFAKSQWQPCANSRYVAEIEFEGPVQKKNQYEYMANIRFNLAIVPAKPIFQIHLYNGKGLLLGSCKEEKNKITQTEKQYKIIADSGEDPVYFRIELLDEFQ